MTGEVKPFSEGEELFMRLAATGRDAGSVSKESVCWWLARAFATMDAERAKVKKLRAACERLAAADKCNYDRDVMRSEGMFDAARAALAETA